MNSNRNAYPNVDPKFDPQMMHQQQSNPRSNTAPPPYQKQQSQPSIILIFSKNYLYLYLHSFSDGISNERKSGETARLLGLVNR
jgi:hypothetical protein